MDNAKIFSFTWNCESLKTCKFDSKCTENIGEMCSYCKKEKCYIPTFAKHLVEYVRNKDVDIVFISTQEDPYPGGKMHSDYLIHLFKDQDKDRHYQLLKNSRGRFIGVGKTTFSFGTMGLARGLRSSVYFRKSFLDKLKEEKTSIKVSKLTYNCGYVSRNKGGLCINVHIDGKNYSFINCHLPFSSKTLKVYKTKKRYDIYRLPAVKDQNKCFNNIVNTFKKKFKSDFVIIQGDLNYRIKYTEDEDAKNINNKLTSEEDLRFLYEERDELYLQMKDNNMEQFDEGITGESHGPRFLPTCKLVKQKYSQYMECNGTKKKKTSTNREDRLDCQCMEGNFTQCDLKSIQKNGKECYKLGKIRQRAPSWCDRILYKSFKKNIAVACTEYNSYDFSQIMAMSDHRAVYGFFVISKI